MHVMAKFVHYAMDRVGLKKKQFVDPNLRGHSAIFPWCKPKSPRDDFNVQSHR